MKPNMKIYVFLILIFTFPMIQAQENMINLLIGTYTNSCESKGIYVYDFDSVTGDFKFKNTSEPVTNPSYLTISDQDDFVYSVSENDQNGSCVVAFNYQSEDGRLTVLNKSDSKSGGSCFVINDENIGLSPETTE